MSKSAESLLNENGHKVLQYLEDITTNADDIQRRVLTEILSINAHVEYLQSHGLNGSTDPATFKKLIPMVSYEALQPYIDRIANGDTSPILFSNPVTEFVVSSGTSGGQQKLFPVSDEDILRRLSIFSFVSAIAKQLFPDLDKGKDLFFIFTRAEAKTLGGIVAWPFTTSFAKRGLLNNAGNTSPSEAVLCTDTKQALYCQLLFALYQNQQVFRVGSTFASTLVHAMKFLENHWVLLVNDIRTGTINPIITDPSLKTSAMHILKPNPELADFIESECSKGTWEGIITRLWPNTKYLNGVVTGSNSQYIPILDYYSNGLPLVCAFYVATECIGGLNLNLLCNPEEISYTIIPTAAYYEFLPVNRENGLYNSMSEKESNGQEEQLVDLVDVKIGQEYELVVTTYAGLYRYCLGDIIRVTGFKNKAPQFRFVCRKNVSLCLQADKTDENELQKAMNKASSLLNSHGATLIDYTGYADSSSNPGHYVVYWEIRKNPEIYVGSSVYEDCCLAVEESLGYVYRLERAGEKSIGPLEIKIVEDGTFDELMDLKVSRGSVMSQYKTPRCIADAESVELLNSKVVSNYYSSKYPKWEPTPKHTLLSEVV